MIFTSTSFVIFFAVVYGLWLVGRRHYAFATALLLSSSWVFYAHDHWEWLPLLVSYTLVDWAVARWIVTATRPRLALCTGLGFNLGVLGYWKCAPLFAATTDDWTIPYGLSFYALIGVAYLVDVYRQAIPAEASPIRFALYLSFFPHLIAGPILRAREFLTRLQPHTLPTAAAAPMEAVFLLGRGAFKKTVLADRIAIAIDPFFAHVGSASTDGVWAAPYVYLYALQIYLDFSGYTDIARGLALLFGFRWPENFRLPYLAPSVREFWRRWHMTLSFFLRDYLYIPLGGSRHGKWRTAVNVMATFLLGGLWHGSSWTFALWGGLHGVFLLVHRGWCRSRIRAALVSPSHPLAGLARIGAIVLTFHCVCVAWCFFRLTKVHQSLACLRQCIVFDPSRILPGTAIDAALLVLLLGYGLAWVLAHAGLDRMFGIGTSPPASTTPFARGCAWGMSFSLLVLAVLLAPSGERPPFIYFQF